MAILVALAIAVVGGVLAEEIAAWLPRLNKKIVGFAVRILPEEERDGRREEWEAHVDEFPGHLLKLYHAIDLILAAISIARNNYGDPAYLSMTGFIRRVETTNDGHWKIVYRGLDLALLKRAAEVDRLRCKEAADRARVRAARGSLSLFQEVPGQILKQAMIAEMLRGGAMIVLPEVLPKDENCHIP